MKRSQAELVAAVKGHNARTHPITMRQLRLKLLEQGLLTSVEGSMASADTAVKIEWDYSSTIERLNPLVDSIGSVLGLTSEAIDDLFIAARGL
tara:strand:+ start:105 stop:383 length:279 start_codon:yes stop_codon:yes gene_type:complete